MSMYSRASAFAWLGRLTKAVKTNAQRTSKNPVKKGKPNSVRRVERRRLRLSCAEKIVDLHSDQFQYPMTARPQSEVGGSEWWEYDIEWRANATSKDNANKPLLNLEFSQRANVTSLDNTNKSLDFSETVKKIKNRIKKKSTSDNIIRELSELLGEHPVFSAPETSETPELTDLDFLLEEKEKKRKISEGEGDPFIEEAIKSLDDYIRSCDIAPSAEDSEWRSHVLSLYKIRQKKEILIRTKPLPIVDLNRHDELETEECQWLSRKFLSMIDAEEYASDISKNSMDKAMESLFGSLDDVSSSDSKIDEDRAAKVFSFFLIRKIWIPIPWKKTLESLESFLDRVTNPIEEPMDQKALNTAIKILDFLVKDQEFEKYLEIEPNFDASCNERSKAQGGKRFEYLFGNNKVQADHVRPIAIYTGGKIRVITKDSIRNMKYAWVNKFLGDRFRTLPVSVFGGDVKEWKKKANLKLKKDEYYLSGDLESATDLFDGRITDKLIDHFCDLVDLSLENAEEMKSFTTQSLMKVGKKKFRQKRGQLMGSIISFPFLCILSLVTIILSREDWTKKFNKDPAKFLRKFNRAGVNGDDVVFCAKKEHIPSYEKAVKSIGGKLSRGKSLFNKYYFTINSELWTNSRHIRVIRPSFVNGINGENKYFINPSRDWLEFRKSPYMSMEAKEYFGIIEVLKLDIPVSLGGLGLFRRYDEERMKNAFINTCIQRNFEGPMVRSSARLKEDLEHKDQTQFHGEQRWFFVKRDMYKSFFIKKKKKLGWNMSPAEWRMSLTVLNRPDLFDSLKLEPFRYHLTKRMPLPIDKVREIAERKWNGIRRYYYESYDHFMDGYVEKKIPVSLANSLYALASKDTYTSIQAENDFRKDHGMLSLDDWRNAVI